MPFYESNPETTKSLIATFLRGVFPTAILWSNDLRGKGFDAVLFGSVDPLTFDVDSLQRWIDDHPKVKSSLQEVGFGGSQRRATPERGGRSICSPPTPARGERHGRLGSRELSSTPDRNLRLQYLAGMWLNSNRSKEIFRDHSRALPLPEGSVRRQPCAHPGAPAGARRKQPPVGRLRRSPRRPSHPRSSTRRASESIWRWR